MAALQPKTRFTPVSIALISIFSALWIVLNFTVAPLGFQLTRLPTVHAIVIYIVLLLTVWATNRFGAASAVGIIGSTIVLLAGGPLPVVGYAVASILFDAILLLNKHRLTLKPLSIAVAVIATVASSYFAGVFDGIVILNQVPLFAVTFWAGWTALGGSIGLIIALPIIAVLERANVKRVQAQ